MWKIEVTRRNQVYFSSSNISTDTTVIVKDLMLNKSSHFVLKLLSSGTEQNHMLQDQNQLNVIKEYLLKWMSNNEMNQCYRLSYFETLFLSYQKFLEVKIVCSYSKEGHLYWLENSPLT